MTRTRLFHGIIVHRRAVLMGGGSVALLALAGGCSRSASGPANVARVARVSSNHTGSRRQFEDISNAIAPSNSADGAHGGFYTLPWVAEHFVEYAWEQPITTNRVEIYWWADNKLMVLPTAARLTYWNGSEFVPVPGAKLDLLADRYNVAGFPEIHTDRLRVELTGDTKKSVGMLHWKVISAGDAPAFRPVVEAGLDRTLVLGGQTYLNGSVRRLQDASDASLHWSKVSGPGDVLFSDSSIGETTAKVSAPGDYVLQLTATGGGETVSDQLRLRAEAPPPARRLDVVYTTPYAIHNRLWQHRAKALVTRWIPHCITYCERTDLKSGQGGLTNFLEAAKALRGEPHLPHQGYVFSNAWVHQTIESMCIALMLDAQGDAEILAAQAHMRRTLEKWIPIVLGAQEADGYLQTAYTLADRKDWPERWSPDHRIDHEGYVSGYFIESAINHHMLTGGKDLRLYNAARKLADCWVAHLGPGKKPWYDGHQEMEQALVRFGRFVNDIEGGGKGDAYIALARFLLDSRQNGSEYDQSHEPLREQYEAVGHAVRATYFYSGMADIAAETGDRDYQSAVMSIWDNMVNRKYYLTGGIGSGDTDEGFGVNYALRNDAYCEACSSCGLIFFQYKLNLAYHDAKFADLYEETMYNALLGSLDMAGQSYFYDNPLYAQAQRAAWHPVPCCVGNIARTLLMVPTWTYAKDPTGINVNLFIGSRIDVGAIAGTRVEMVQETDYPWKGTVAITVNPAQPKRFAVRVRVPDRATSALYSATPKLSGLTSLKVNGATVKPDMQKGYAVIDRDWKAGDRIELELPLAVQRVTASNDIAATRGKVALRYGPLVYNVESADQSRLDLPLAKGPLSTEWRNDLLRGVLVIKGQWSDGSPMLAIPNYARMNRAGPTTEYPVPPKPSDPSPSLVWMVDTA